MLDFNEKIYNVTALRRKKTRKETKIYIQFKIEINYSSSRSTINLPHY